MRRQAERPRDRRDRIVSTAANLFGTDGFAHVSIADIARQEGITGPAIYRHFASKQLILDAVIARLLGDLTLALVDASGSKQDEGARLTAAIAATWSYALQQPWPLATYLRDEGYLPSNLLIGIAERRSLLTDSWLRVAPGIGDHEYVDTRVQSLLGALGPLASRPTPGA